ncbi:Uncharacterised protein [uncultured archaeon]|nr:Uncharacterised protein [uncultured archaeon]
MNFIGESLPREINLFVSKDVSKMGIDVVMASFAGTNISNKNEALERYKKEKMPFIKKHDLNNPIL